MSTPGGVPNARNRNGDRFYCPPPVRKQRLIQQQLKEQQEKEKEKGLNSCCIDSEKVSEDSSSSSATSSVTDSVCSISPPTVDCNTNLDRFLQCTTPVVAAQRLTKVSFFMVNFRVFCILGIRVSFSLKLDVFFKC